MKTLISASLLLLGLFAGAAHAADISKSGFTGITGAVPSSATFTDLATTAPRLSIFDDINATAPRSTIFVDISRTAPRSDGAFGTLEMNTP